MQRTLDRAFHWSPRVLGIALAAFLSLFALDAFEGDHALWEKVMHFVMHLLFPTGLLLAAVIVGWTRPLHGAILCLVLVAASMVVFRTVSWQPHVIVTIPAGLIGALMLIDWVRSRPAASPP